MCLIADNTEKTTMRCCCGQDCAKCMIYLATVRDDDTLRARAQLLYRDTFGRDIPLADFHCLGVFSECVFSLCRECPWVKCCRQHGVAACEECERFPCPEIRDYREKHVNQYNVTENE